MRLEQLQYFIETASSKSISIAAENLYISQPALSRSIKALEKELDVPLLVRTVDGVRLTEAGEELLPFMRDVIAKVNELVAASKYYSQSTIFSKEFSGEFTICTIPVIADILLLPALEEMSNLFPSINIKIQIVDFNEPLSVSLPSDADLLLWMNIDGALDYALSTIDVQVEPLFSDNFSIVVVKDHPLSKKKIVTLEEALSYKIIAHHNGLNLEYFYSNFTKQSQPLNILLKSNNNRVITSALVNQNAVLITNNLVIQTDYRNNPDLISIPLKNRKGTYFCLYQENNIYLPVIKEFITLLKANHAGI